MMIVGTVQQEDECSWQDACNAWVAQDEEAVAGVYQVGADQEISEPAAGGQCKKASTERSDERPLEVEDLLVEEEEQEYILELLMRRASPERPKKSLPSKGEADPARHRKSKNKGKKARKGNLSRGTTNEAPKEEKAASPGCGEERQVASNLAHNPKAKGRGLAEKNQQERDQAMELPATSGGECSGQKKPEYS
jgi:hypothetical protein